MIGLTPLIALIYISVEPAVTQNCVASVTNKQNYDFDKCIRCFPNSYEIWTFETCLFETFIVKNTNAIL